MRPSSKLLAASLAGAVTIALLAVMLFSFGRSTDTVQATGGGSPEAFIDMDSSTAYPTVESCISVAAGGSFSYQTVLDAVATGQDLDAFGYAVIGLPEAVGTSGFTWTAQTHIGAAPYFSITADDLSEAVPDPPGSLSGTHGTTVGHIFTAGPVTPAGTVVRLGLYSVGVGATTPSGVYTIQFDPTGGLTSFVSASSTDWFASVAYVGSAYEGQVAVGMPCPLPVNYLVTGPATVSAPPTALITSPAVFGVTVSGASVVNLLPAPPVSLATIAVTLTTPGDCTVTTANPVIIGPGFPVPPTPPGAPAPIPLAPFTVSCTNPSFHTFSASITATPDVDLEMFAPDNTLATTPGLGDTTAITQNTDLSSGPITICAGGGAPVAPCTSTSSAIPCPAYPTTCASFLVQSLTGVAGTTLPITLKKSIANNDLDLTNPAVPYADTIGLSQVNPFMLNCLVANGVGGPWAIGQSQTQTGTIASSASIAISATFYLRCGAQGYNYDDDGDGTSGDPDLPPVFGDANGPGVKDVCQDEDQPNGFDDDLGLCPLGAGDAEDPNVALPILAASDVVVPNPAAQAVIDGHIVDTVPGNDGNAGGPAIFMGVLPFATTSVITVDDADPTNQGNAVADDTCVDTLPCRQVVNSTIAAGGPLAVIQTRRGLDGGYAMTKGNLVPNGSVSGRGAFAATLSLVPGTLCVSGVPIVTDLVDSEIAGGVTNAPNALFALGFTGSGSWSTKLDALVNFVDDTDQDGPGSDTGAIDGYPPLWRRDMGIAPVGSPGIPLNYLTFNLGGLLSPTGPWLTITAIGDPDNDNDGIYDDIDPNDDTPNPGPPVLVGSDLIPDFADSDKDGDGLNNGNELEQCSPLSASTVYVGASPTNGQVIITCAAVGTHPDNQSFTRADLGTTTISSSTDECKANKADMAVTLSKDETPGNGVGGPVDSDADTQIDEDPTVNGIDEDGDGADGEDPTGDIVASNVPQGMPVSTTVSLVAPSTGPTMPEITLTGISSEACDITWKSASAGDIIQNITASPKKISKITIDPATILPLSVPLNPSDTYTRKYEVTCPAGPGAPENAALNQCNDTLDNDADTVVDDGCISFYSNIKPAVGQPTDPEVLNDQAENHLGLIATNDVDGDGDANEDDNCLWTANPNQLDTDGDGIGDACDIDDDGDGIPDGPDQCELLAEDFDLNSDGDGCPDTDAGASATKDEEYDVDVSTNHSGDGRDADLVDDTLINITATNGNYPATLTVSALIVSVLGSCEARIIPQAGDSLLEFDDGTHLFSQIERSSGPLAAGGVYATTRSYTVHCNQRSTHHGLDGSPVPSGADQEGIEIQVSAIPNLPVREEGVDSSMECFVNEVDPPCQENVVKNYPIIHAWDRADLKKVSLKVWNVATDCSSPLLPVPATINVGQTLNLCVVEKVHNNGPVATTATDVLSYSSLEDNGLPTGPDCTFAPVSPWTTNLASIPVNGDASFFHVITVTCDAPSYHSLQFSDTVSIPATEVHVYDPNLLNNTKTAAVNFAVLGTGDVAVSSVAVAGGADVAVNTPFTVTVNGTVTLTNFASANVVIALTSSTDNNGDTVPDCTLTPTGGQNQLVVASGPVSATWSVSCNYISDHVFLGSVTATAVPIIHVTETNTGNNTGSNSDTVGITSTADIKILAFTATDDMALAGNQILVTAGEVAGPAAVGPAEAGYQCGNDNDDDGDTIANDGCGALSPSPRSFSTNQTLHNNGPFGPLSVTDTVTPSNCAVAVMSPASQSPTVILPVSTDVAPTQNWTVNWTNLNKPPFSCSAWINKSLTFSLGHVTDPNLANNDATVYITFVRDTDGDGVPDNFNGVIDNCERIANPGQANSDAPLDLIGDACDSTHDDVVKSITVLGPAPINLSDTVGRYMWVIGEIGNHSAHTDKVTIGTPQPAAVVTAESGSQCGNDVDDDGDTVADDGCPPEISVTGLPTGCTIQKVLIVPGQATFLMTPGEQKFVAYRVRFECHAPLQVPAGTASAGVYPAIVTLSIAHDDTYGTPTGNDVNPSNNSKSYTKPIVVEAP